MFKRVMRIFCIYFVKQKLLPKSEFRIFVQRNRFFLAISALCLLLYTKQSDAPFWGNYNAITSFLFAKPDAASPSGSIFLFFCELGLAFITSFVFYLFVDYFPMRKRERTAFRLMAEKIERIDILLGKLFSFLMFITKTGTCFVDLHPLDVPNLCGLSLTNTEIHCHSKVTNIATQEILEEGNPDCINYFFGLKEYASSILNLTQSIFDLPYSGNIEDQLLQIMAKFKNNRMLQNLASMPDDYILSPHAKSYVCNYSSDDVRELYFQFLLLRSYPYLKSIVTIEAASPESIRTANKTMKAMQAQFPESFKLMEELQNRISKKQKN